MRPGNEENLMLQRTMRGCVVCVCVGGGGGIRIVSLGNSLEKSLRHLAAFVGRRPVSAARQDNQRTRFGPDGMPSPRAGGRIARRSSTRELVMASMIMLCINRNSEAHIGGCPGAIRHQQAMSHRIWITGETFLVVLSLVHYCHIQGQCGPPRVGRSRDRPHDACQWVHPRAGVRKPN
jgi:hypothetical protein